MEHPAPRQTIEVLESFWEFRYVENPGFAFSVERFLPHSISTTLIVGVRLIILIALLVWLWRADPREVGLRIGLTLVAGGALGNLIDGARLGFVIDFVQWYVTVDGVPRYWPTFNVADAAIVVGIGLMVLQMLPRKRKSKADTRASS